MMDRMRVWKKKQKNHVQQKSFSQTNKPNVGGKYRNRQVIRLFLQFLTLSPIYLTCSLTFFVYFPHHDSFTFIFPQFLWCRLFLTCTDRYCHYLVYQRNEALCRKYRSSSIIYLTMFGLYNHSNPLQHYRKCFSSLHGEIAKLSIVFSGHFYLCTFMAIQFVQT